MRLHFRVRESTLFCYGCEAPVGGSTGYITCDFKFLTKDWDDVTAAYAVFSLKDSDPVEQYATIITNGIIGDDKHVNLHNGTWNVNVVGINSKGLRIVTDAWPVLVANPLIAPAFPELEKNDGEIILALAAEANKKADEALEKASETEKYVDEIKSIRDEINDVIKDIDVRSIRFNSMEEAEVYVKEHELTGCIISVYEVSSGWKAYIVQEDFSIQPICGCDITNFDILDGGCAGGDRYNFDVIDGLGAENENKDILLDGGYV